MVDVAAACGSSEVTDCAAYLTAMTEITFTVTYVAYNGVQADGTAYVAPTTEPAAEAAETTPAETTPAEETSEPAETGIVLALLPMAVAAAAVVVSKRK